jgi:hypothetical protein
MFVWVVSGGCGVFLFWRFGVCCSVWFFGLFWVVGAGFLGWVLRCVFSSIPYRDERVVFWRLLVVLFVKRLFLAS